MSMTLVILNPRNTLQIDRFMTEEREGHANKAILRSVTQFRLSDRTRLRSLSLLADCNLVIDDPHGQDLVVHWLRGTPKPSLRRMNVPDMCVSDHIAV
jgi:hypothetical protein